ncbi:hypothetical protein DGI_0180 [Megalodesulfovibrio gigas DSM 1382 = ATCC 19364]|uniref:Uncharacterized protein n=1 Tax=Megalodesulfovibrio gigas (strain ATCC 19364 / DSM 1382 / NCIMB 9332 / VKM B-1759) TaxID=1121448 RepID=T2G8B4_MEGG1|nr:hypothetical protein DGI_0180 [Megalodesulfovibrio gigas DSM 1382 = ATCC 19364]
MQDTATPASRTQLPFPAPIPAGIVAGQRTGGAVSARGGATRPGGLGSTGALMCGNKLDKRLPSVTRLQ